LTSANLSARKVNLLSKISQTSLRTEMLGRIETISRELDELRNAIEAIKP
jgi:hypothetical protein